APDASAAASAASRPARGAGGAGAVGQAPQATRDQLAAAGLAALAVRARPTDVTTRVTRGRWRTRCAGPSPATAAQPRRRDRRTKGACADALTNAPPYKWRRL